MKDRKFKREFTSTVRTPRQAFEDVQPSLIRRQLRPTHPDDMKGGSMLTQPMLLLEKLAGAMLGGIGVTALIGNILICVLLLMLGPAFLMELLAK